jgi:8-oxo-dGTP pyrophosphatase MutT (NUDIX family)
MSNSETVYSCDFFRVLYSRFSNGSITKPFYVVDFGPRAGLVLTRANEVLLVKQFRYLPNDYSWELPGGTVKLSESSEDGARRECLEETGVRCGVLERLVVYFPGLDNVNNETSVFLCKDFEEEWGVGFELGEISEVRWFHIDEAIGMIRSAQILDAMTIMGLMSYKLGFYDGE